MQQRATRGGGEPEPEGEKEKYSERERAKKMERASYEGKHLCNYIHASNRNNALGSRRLDKKHFHKTTITILIIQLHK